MTALQLSDLEWLTVRQAAQLINVSESKIRKAITQGKIKVFKDDKIIRINRKEMNKYIKGRVQ